MLDPITLYSPDGSTVRRIPAVDAAGWLASGWTPSPPSNVAGLPTHNEDKGIALNDSRSEASVHNHNQIPLKEESHLPSKQQPKTSGK